MQNSMSHSGTPGPKGDTGERGEPGTTGDRGQPGAKGERGEAGLDGNVGERVSNIVEMFVRFGEKQIRSVCSERTGSYRSSRFDRFEGRTRPARHAGPVRFAWRCRPEGTAWRAGCRRPARAGDDQHQFRDGRLEQSHGWLHVPGRTARFAGQRRSCRQRWPAGTQRRRGSAGYDRVAGTARREGRARFEGVGRSEGRSGWRRAARSERHSAGRSRVECYQGE